MKSFVAIAALAALAVLAPATHAWAEAGSHLIISNLKVPNRSQLQAGVPYEASLDIRTPGESVAIRQLCFFWNKDGPYCFPFKMLKGADGKVRPTTGLRTGNPGKYKLTAVMTYSYDGKRYETNQTSINITVRPR